MNMIIGVCGFVILAVVSLIIGGLPLTVLAMQGSASLSAYFALVVAVLFGALSIKSLLWGFKRKRE